MFLPALVAFLLLPGVVAFAVPILLLRQGGVTQLVHPLGLVPLVLGAMGLFWCVRDFYVQGKGTLAPWAPPRELVVIGLYRWSRNPMYVAVALILVGWAWSFGAAGLLLYAAAFSLAFHLRVVHGEEPWLAQVHGAAWLEYAERVPRWLPVRAKRFGHSPSP